MAADNCVGILAKMLGLFGSPFYSPSTLPPFLPLFIWGVSKRLEKLDSYELRRKGKERKRRKEIWKDFIYRRGRAAVTARRSKTLEPRLVQALGAEYRADFGVSFKCGTRARRCVAVVEGVGVMGDERTSFVTSIGSRRVAHAVRQVIAAAAAAAFVVR